MTVGASPTVTIEARDRSKPCSGIACDLYRYEMARSVRLVFAAEMFVSGPIIAKMGDRAGDAAADQSSTSRSHRGTALDESAGIGASTV